MYNFNHREIEEVCTRCGRETALWNGLCAECLEEQQREDEIVEARQDVLEFMDRQLRILGVEEHILDEVWSATCEKFGLGETV